MNRRNFLCALVAVPVVAVVAPLLPASRSVNGELVEMYATPLRMGGSMYRLSPEWSLGYKADWSDPIVDQHHYIRVEHTVES